MTCKPKDTRFLQTWVGRSCLDCESWHQVHPTATCSTALRTCVHFHGTAAWKLLRTSQVVGTNCWPRLQGVCWNATLYAFTKVTERCCRSSTKSDVFVCARNSLSQSSYFSFCHYCHNLQVLELQPYSEFGPVWHFLNLDGILLTDSWHRLSVAGRRNDPVARRCRDWQPFVAATANRSPPTNESRTDSTLSQAAKCDSFRCSGAVGWTSVQRRSIRRRGIFQCTGRYVTGREHRKGRSRT